MVQHGCTDDELVFSWQPACFQRSAGPKRGTERFVGTGRPASAKQRAKSCNLNMSSNTIFVYVISRAAVCISVAREPTDRPASDRPTGRRSASRPVGRSVGRPVVWSVGRSAGRPVQFIIAPTGRPTDWPTGRPTGPANRPADRPIEGPADRPDRPTHRPPDRPDQPTVGPTPLYPRLAQ